MTTNTIIKRLFITVFSAMFALAGISAYAADAPVGIIISTYSGAWVQHAGGVKETLALKTPVYKGDIISTDKTGKAQVLFNDDTSLAVAPMSVINIDDFVYNDANKPYFSVKVVRGASRVISGKIVEQNPIGFKLSSPRGTAGIRGTVVSVVVGPGDDIFSIDSIDPRHFVDISQNTNIVNTTRSALEGYSIVVSDNPEMQNFQRKTTEEERSLMNEVFSSKPVPADNGNQQASAETQEQADGNGKAADTTTSKNAKQDKEDGSDSEQTADSGKSEQSEGAVTGNVDSGSVSGDGKTEAVVDSKNNPGVSDVIVTEATKDKSDKTNLPVELPKTFNAFYAGNLNAGDGVGASNFSGNFGFKVDLNTGEFSDGYINAQSKGFGVVNASGGTGVFTKDGVFTSGSYNVSGTGDYEGANGALMSGKVTSENANVDSWLISGNGNTGTLISGTGSGAVTDSIKDSPFVDRKGSFVGTLSATPSVSASGVDGSAEAGFGFNMLLVSGIISDAYMFYADDGLRGIKAEGGTGRANLKDANNYGGFTINFASTTGYGSLYKATMGNSNLSGSINANDTGVTITGGTMGDVTVNSGTGGLVANLPGITSTKTVAFSGSWRSSAGTGELVKGDTYYETGFKLNLLTGKVTDMYAYGGTYGDTEGAIGNPIDGTSFFTTGETGTITAKTFDMKLRKVQLGEGASTFNSGLFSLGGAFDDSFASYTGGLKYNGNFFLSSTQQSVSAAAAFNNSVLPFMIGFYEGDRTDADGTEISSGFKINLVNGNLSQGYLVITNGSNKISGNYGTGLINRSDRQFTMTFNYLQSFGTYKETTSASLSGFANSDYNSLTVNNITTAGTGAIYSSTTGMGMNKVESLKSITAYYSGNIPGRPTAGLLAHNGGKIGFLVDVKQGTISDADFYINRTGTDGAIYGSEGTGLLLGNDIHVNWGTSSTDKGTVAQTNKATGTQYNAAMLTGDIASAAILYVRSGSGSGAIDTLVDNTITFPNIQNDVSVKKGTVAGNLSGAGISSGSYKFNANLTSGIITEGQINLNSGSSKAALSGGVGMINGNNFNINGYEGTTSGVFFETKGGNMSGNQNNGSFTNVQWQLNNAAGNAIHSGTGSNATLK